MEAEPGNDAGQDLAGPVSPSPSPGEEPRDLDQLQPGSPQPQTEDGELLNSLLLTPYRTVP